MSDRGYLLIQAILQALLGICFYHNLSKMQKIMAAASKALAVVTVLQGSVCLCSTTCILKGKIRMCTNIVTAGGMVKGNSDTQKHTGVQSNLCKVTALQTLSTESIV